MELPAMKVIARGGGAAGIAGEGGVGDHHLDLLERHAESLGSHLRHGSMRALTHVGAGMVHHHALDLRCPVELHRGGAILLVAEGEADVLEGGGITDATPQMRLGRRRLFRLGF